MELLKKQALARKLICRTTCCKFGSRCEGTKLRVMLDTNILVSAIFFPSAQTRTLISEIICNHSLVLCDYVLEELRLVVERKFLAKSMALEHFFSACALSWFIFLRLLITQIFHQFATIRIRQYLQRQYRITLMYSSLATKIF